MMVFNSKCVTQLYKEILEDKIFENTDERFVELDKEVLPKAVITEIVLIQSIPTPPRVEMVVLEENVKGRNAEK